MIPLIRVHNRWARTVIYDRPGDASGLRLKPRWALIRARASHSGDGEQVVMDVGGREDGGRPEDTEQLYIKTIQLVA